MPLSFEKDILPETCGLQLCKIVRDELQMSEECYFDGGRDAVLTTLNRASISGHVGGSVDRDTEYWADQLSSEGDSLGEIRLDRESWNALKNKWMRCRMVS